MTAAGRNSAAVGKFAGALCIIPRCSFRCDEPGCTRHFEVSRVDRKTRKVLGRWCVEHARALPFAPLPPPLTGTR